MSYDPLGPEAFYVLDNNYLSRNKPPRRFSEFFHMALLEGHSFTNEGQIQSGDSGPYFQIVKDVFPGTSAPKTVYYCFSLADLELLSTPLQKVDASKSAQQLSNSRITVGKLMDRNWKHSQSEQIIAQMQKAVEERKRLFTECFAELGQTKSAGVSSHPAALPSDLVINWSVGRISEKNLSVFPAGKIKQVNDFRTSLESVSLYFRQRKAQVTFQHAVPVNKSLIVKVVFSGDAESEKLMEDLVDAEYKKAIPPVVKLVVKRHPDDNEPVLFPRGTNPERDLKRDRLRRTNLLARALDGFPKSKI